MNQMKMKMTPQKICLDSLINSQATKAFIFCNSNKIHVKSNKAGVSIKYNKKRVCWTSKNNKNWTHKSCQLKTKHYQRNNQQ